MRFDLPDIPKVLAPIDNKPLLHHIILYYKSMKLFNQFILCLGNGSDKIKDSFFGGSGDERNRVIKWNDVDLLLLETGINSTATYRIQKATEHIEDATFFVSYADVIGDIDLHSMLAFHQKHKGNATMALVKTQMPYGQAILSEDGSIKSFIEKPILNHWINAGISIFNKSIFRDIDAELELEKDFFTLLANKKSGLYGYKHNGFWKGIDTYKDLLLLREQWADIKGRIITNNF